MLREFRLIKNGLKIGFQQTFEDLAGCWRQRFCHHNFRPAVKDKNPARVCKLCDKLELLTKEEFFAYFGEIGQGMLH